MPPEAIARHWRGATARLPIAWRAPLVALAAAWAALLLLFREDWATMAGQWWNSSTYNHIVLVPAIVGWLVSMRAAQLARLDPRPWAPGLALVAGAAVLWALGAFSGFNLARQVAAVFALMACVPLLLGVRVTLGLMFPLGYMLFLVPFGDELVPPLQMITAAITVALVHASGIPAAIDGVFIDTPAGLFEVAEACSGVKFLVAMVAFGVLVANVCFREWKRRILFLATCVAMPVLANGVRAWGTVWVAQHVGAEKATGFDHIVYGWVFFAVVIALVLLLSWRFFDRPGNDPMIDADRLRSMALPRRLEAAAASVPVLLAALAAIVLAAQGWAHAAARLEADVPPRLDLPQVEGWTRADYEPQAWWEPRAAGAAHRLLGRYVDGQGRAVDVFLAVYAAQDEGREAGGFGEGALPPEGQGWAWLSPAPAFDGGKGDRLLARGAVERNAITWYRTGDLLTGSNMRLKLANTRDRLLLRARPTAVLILSAEKAGDADPAEALAAFRAAAGPLGPWMDRAAKLR